MEEYLKPKFEDLEIHKIISEYEFENGMHEEFLAELKKCKDSYHVFKKQDAIQKWQKYLKNLFFELHNIEEENAVPITEQPIEEVAPISESIVEEKTIDKTPDQIVFEDLIDRTKRGKTIMLLSELKEYNIPEINELLKLKEGFNLYDRENGFNFDFTLSKNKNEFILIRKQL